MGEICGGNGAASLREPRPGWLRHADGHARYQCGETQFGKIDRQIAALEKEKAENDQRLLAGIGAGTCRHQHRRRTYGRNVAIATGEWAGVIDRKLAELRRAKKKC
jgi:hypothetical protein